MSERTLSSAALPAGGLAALGLVAGAVALLLSFRLPFGAVDPALAANLDRLLAAGAAGLALASAGALRQRVHEGPPLREPMLFALSTGGAGGFVVGLGFSGSAVLAWMLAGLGAVLFAGIVAALDRRARAWNLALGIVLAAMGIASVPTVLVAATWGSVAGPAFWLLGDVSHAAGVGAPLALGLAGIGCGAAAVAATPERLESRPEAARTTSAVLLGLGIGIAGPIAFVAWFAPWLVRSLAGRLSGPRQVVLAGLL